MPVAENMCLVAHTILFSGVHVVEVVPPRSRAGGLDEDWSPRLCGKSMLVKVGRVPGFIVKNTPVHFAGLLVRSDTWHGAKVAKFFKRVQWYTVGTRFFFSHKKNS